ncbi:MAG: methionyl-tRNA formyltransferase [Actinomycetaceae bacterium]|nr:methionyl-tRNA formyltransferase [Actinomycetaceae bacterium]
MRLIFAGSPSVALPVLNALVNSSHEVVGVLTRPDAPAGRGRTLRSSAVKEKAEEYGLEVFTPNSLKDETAQNVIASWEADLAIVVAYGMLIPPKLLQTPRFGWVNVHFSRLPAWRGAAPVQRAIMAGDQETGITLFQIEEGLDTGPIWGMSSQRIGKGDTAETLLESLALSSVPLTMEVIEKIAAGNVTPVEQTDSGITYAPQLSVQEGFVDFQTDASSLDCLIRGVTPNPGAWTWDLKGQRLKLGPIDPGGTFDASLQPGQLAVTKNAVWVGSTTRPVQLSWVAPAGKGRMEASAWARGARIQADSRLGIPHE